MEIALLIIGIIIVLLLIAVVILVLKNGKEGKMALGQDDRKLIHDEVSSSFHDFSSSVGELINEKNSSYMKEMAGQYQNLSNEIEKMKNSFSDFRMETNQKMTDISFNMNKLLSENNEKIDSSFKDMLLKIDEISKNDNERDSKMKEELLSQITSEMKSFHQEVNEVFASFEKNIKEKFDNFNSSTKESIYHLESSVSKDLADIREDNKDKLALIEQSVNSKLDETLQERLNDSFQAVISQITNVNTAVGEIKGIASDVSSLKNVLANVKVKGIVGEVILGNIISDFLTKDQYEENVATRKGSTERVEYAIILPGKEEQKIYLPVDSKFPYNTYEELMAATDKETAQSCRDTLKRQILTYAKEISDKYLDVPNTTDFAIMFLPVEGLYLEVVNMGLFEEIQNKYKVNVTGPTTFSAFVQSLQMGFRSLMIQKRSAEVFQLLGAIKTEFGKFSKALETTQAHLNRASDDLNTLVSTRTRAMNRKLNNIEALGEEESQEILEEE